MELGHWGGRPGRPHGWAVLAVSLALLALVVAVTGAPHKGRAGFARDSPATTGAGSRHPIDERGQRPTEHLPTPTPPSSAVSNGSDESTTAQTVAARSGDSKATSAVTTSQARLLPTADNTQPTPSTISSPATTTLGGVDQQIIVGNFDYPVDSAMYAVPSLEGSLVVTATWTGTPSLLVTLGCEGNKQTDSGPSGLSVVASTNGGNCDLVLAEPSGDQDTVAYTLTIDNELSSQASP